MPNRILKETICTSEQIDGLTPEQEVFFYRLMVVCDDFGLMDARPAILKARCYPLKSIDIKKIQVLVNVLANHGLIFTYTVDGKPYIKIAKWEEHQQIRAKRPKYPMPEDGVISPDINCYQMHEDAPVIQSNPIQSESNPNPICDESDGEEIEVVSGLDLRAWECWVNYRKQIRKPIKQVSIPAAQRELAGYGNNQAAVVEQSIAAGYQGLFSLKTKGATNANSRADVIAAFTGSAGRQPAVFDGTAERVAGCG